MSQPDGGETIRSHPIRTRTRPRRLAGAVATLAILAVASGCGLFGSDDTEPVAEADSGGVAVDTVATGSTGQGGVAGQLGSAIGPPPLLPPEEVTADAAAADEPVDGGSAVPPEGAADVAAAQESTLDSLEARIDRLLDGQEALARRLDSIDGGARQAAASEQVAGEVLGEARRQVSGFGVGVAWSLVVVLLFNYAIRGIVWLLDTLAERNAARRLFFKRLVPVIRIVLWIFAAYLIVRVIFGVDAQGIIAAAAAIGVAVGFAAQDLLKNLFGGLILVFDQPFQVGDKVSVGGTYGEVVSIGLRSTRIVTPDDSLVSVPNAQVVDQQVANANAGELNCQVVTDLYLPGWADEVKAKKIAFEAAASSKYVFLNKPIVVLVSDVFKETFLTRVRVKAYVLDPRLEFLFQSDVTERAREGFRGAGLLRPEHLRTELVQRTAVGWDAVSADAGRPATAGRSGGDDERG